MERFENDTGGGAGGGGAGGAGVGVQGVQGWWSGEITRLPPMWPGFDSQTRRLI